MSGPAYGSYDDCPYSAFNTDLEMIDTYCLPNWEDGKDAIIEIFKNLGESDSASKYVVDIINSW